MVNKTTVLGGRCERCKERVPYLNYSEFNKELICRVCEDREKRHPRYQEAKESDVYIGKPIDLAPRVPHYEALETWIEFHGGYWHGEVPEHPRNEWIEAIDNDETIMGYWEWSYAEEHSEDGTENDDFER